MNAMDYKYNGFIACCFNSLFCDAGLNKVDYAAVRLIGGDLSPVL